MPYDEEFDFDLVLAACGFEARQVYFVGLREVITSGTPNKAAATMSYLGVTLGRFRRQCNKIGDRRGGRRRRTALEHERR